MRPLKNSNEIRKIEAAHSGGDGSTLMQRAGKAIVHQVKTMLKRRPGTVLVLAGPGNNGGDAWVAANLLKAAGIDVFVWPLNEERSSNPAATKAHTAYAKKGGKIIGKPEENQGFSLIVDGLFGIGLSRAPTPQAANMIDWVNSYRDRYGAPVIAVDIPSGLNADTGYVAGKVIRADLTLTFLADKPGLHTADGRDMAGEVIVEPLGIVIDQSSTELLESETVAALIPARRHNSHKGSHGSVGIIGGNTGMIGAAVLAARGALHMGPGKVFLGILDQSAPGVDWLHPEIMVRPAVQLIADVPVDVMAIGMGLGTDDNAIKLLQGALSQKHPLVLDADALNIIASNNSIGEAFRAKMSEDARQSKTFIPSVILTPHPGEAAELLKVTTQAVQKDRLAAARKLALMFNSVVVLKGSGTVIALPDGHCDINPVGNPGMASGGMGDVLAGMLAALMAQGLDAMSAARLGVYVHGAAADACVDHGMAPLGLTASEVMFEARNLLNSRLQHHHD